MFKLFQHFTICALISLPLAIQPSMINIAHYDQLNKDKRLAENELYTIKEKIETNKESLKTIQKDQNKRKKYLITISSIALLSTIASLYTYKTTSQNNTHLPTASLTLGVTSLALWTASFWGLNKHHEFNKKDLQKHKEVKLGRLKSRRL